MEIKTGAVNSIQGVLSYKPSPAYDGHLKFAGPGKIQTSFGITR